MEPIAVSAGLLEPFHAFSQTLTGSRRICFMHCPRSRPWRTLTSSSRNSLRCRCRSLYNAADEAAFHRQRADGRGSADLAQCVTPGPCAGASWHAYRNRVPMTVGARDDDRPRHWRNRSAWAHRLPDPDIRWTGEQAVFSLAQATAARGGRWMARGWIGPDGGCAPCRLVATVAQACDGLQAVASIVMAAVLEPALGAGTRAHFAQPTRAPVTAPAQAPTRRLEPACLF